MRNLKLFLYATGDVISWFLVCTNFEMAYNHTALVAKIVFQTLAFVSACCCMLFFNKFENTRKAHILPTALRDAITVQCSLCRSDRMLNLWEVRRAVDRTEGLLDYCAKCGATLQLALADTPEWKQLIFEKQHIAACREQAAEFNQTVKEQARIS